MKKVLIFIEDGSFTYVKRVIRETSALINEGWEVTVVSQKGPEIHYFYGNKNY